MSFHGTVSSYQNPVSSFVASNIAASFVQALQETSSLEHSAAHTGTGQPSYRGRVTARESLQKIATTGKTSGARIEIGREVTSCMCWQSGGLGGQRLDVWWTQRAELCGVNKINDLARVGT